MCTNAVLLRPNCVDCVFECAKIAIIEGQSIFHLICFFEDGCQAELVDDIQPFEGVADMLPGFC